MSGVKACGRIGVVHTQRPPLAAEQRTRTWRQNVCHAAIGSENFVARTVQTGPPAPEFAFYSLCPLCHSENHRRPLAFDFSHKCRSAVVQPRISARRTTPRDIVL